MRDKTWVPLLGLLFAIALACAAATADRRASAQNKNTNGDITGGLGTLVPGSNAGEKRKAPARRPPAPAARGPRAGDARGGDPAGSVRLDLLAVPAGFMSGAGRPQDFITQSVAPDVCHTGAECVRFSYKSGAGWGAVMWWPRACGASGTDDAWAKLKRGGCGVDVREAGGLRSVARLTFMAKGERGQEVLEFKVGADDVEPTPARQLGSVTLTRDWRKYEVDLKGADLKRASALFVWAATDAANPQGAVFYLDDIQFEGVK